MAVEFAPEAPQVLAALPPTALWVKLKHTWLNLANVTFIEDGDFCLKVYFRLDYDAYLRQPALHRGYGERLYLIGEEAAELRSFLHQHGLMLTPPVPPKPTDEW
ncbi:MAG: hypothetical protein M3458_19100 [Acidobacteriota bacterium]|nr:hypothetical protein [Acidobacteriota bacterium]